MVDLAAFSVKASISAVLQHVKNIEQSLHMSESFSPGMARSLRKARQSIEEWWQDTQAVSFVNTGINHALIPMADVSVREVHAGIVTIMAQALSIGTGTYDHSLVTLTKDIPISSTSLFGGDLSKAMAKAASTLVDSFFSV